MMATVKWSIQRLREMFAEVTIALCVNDANGEPTYRLMAVHVREGAGIDLQPTRDGYPRDVYPVCHRPHGTTDILHVGHLVISIGSYQPHAAGLLGLNGSPWDVITTSRGDARRLIRYLLETRGWTLVDAPLNSDLVPAEQLDLNRSLA